MVIRSAMASGEPVQPMKPLALAVPRAAANDLDLVNGIQAACEGQSTRPAQTRSARQVDVDAQLDGAVQNSEFGYSASARKGNSRSVFGSAIRSGASSGGPRGDLQLLDAASRPANSSARPSSTESTASIR